MDATCSHQCLYNLAAFSGLNIRGEQRYHRIDFMKNNRLVGTLAGVMDGTVFTSGYSAGFGGPDFSRDEERFEDICDLVDHALGQLRAAGVGTVIIRAKPAHYSLCEPFLNFALMRQGFDIVDGSLNFYIDFSRLGSMDLYVKSLKSSARRSLRHAMEVRHAWRKADDEPDWRAGYRALQANRQDMHGAELSLPYDYISSLRNIFGERIEMYVLEVNDAVAAASLVYRIRPRHSQVMYWGDCKRGEIPGLMNMLAYYTVQTGLAQGLNAIDLGPSASLDRANIGGIAFKVAIGAQPNMRYTYRRFL